MQYNIAGRPQLLNYYANLMANALIVNSSHRLKGKRVAVGTIGMVTTFKENMERSHPLFGLGNKLQEELISALSQKSINVVEFRATQNLVVNSHQDIMLSRELTHLQPTQNVNYYLTGTYANQYQGAAINLRLIDINTNDVIASESHFVPLNAFALYKNRTTSSVNGHIYRNASPRFKRSL